MTLSDPDAPQRPAKTPASRKRRRAAAAAAAVALFLCLAIAVFLTNRIGASRIEIAIDLLSEPDSAPILVIVDGDGEARSREPMARVADEFARHIGSLEFKPTGRRNLKSRGILVGFTCTAAGLDEIENLPKGWRRADEWIVGAPGAQPFKWVGLSDDAALILRKWPFGGIASVTTAQGATEYDLYRTEGEASQRVSVPPQVQLVRYTAPIARRAAAQARLELPATAYSTIFRLYVGSALPVIDYPGSRLTTEPWGRVLHGWSPRVQDGRLLLPPIPAWEQGGAATFALAAAATAMALALSAAAAWLLWRLARWLMTAPESRRVLAPFRLAPFCGFFVPLALMWLVFLGAYYPGAMSADSIDQWRQTRTMDLNTVHPAFHTLTIKTITLLWRSPAAVALVQILGLSLVCAWAYSLLLRAGVPRMAVFAAWATTLCSLRNGTMAVTLWKDNFYAIAVFGFILAAAQCLLDAPSREKRWPWAALGAALALMPLYRHNGLPLSVLLFPALVWTFWPRRKKALLAGAAALLVYLSATEGLYPLFHVRRSSFAGILLERRLSMLRDQDAPFSQEELSRMRELQALPEFWVRRPGEAPPPVPDPLKLVWAPVSPPDARALTLWVIQRCPLFFLRAQIWMNGYLYWPAPLRGDSMAASWRDIKKNEEGLAMRPLLPGANRALNALAISTAKSRWAWLIWRPALPLYCTALALAALLWRLRDWRWLILYLPGLLNSASVFLLAMSAEQRYQFPLTLAAGFLVCLALLPKERRE